MNLFETAITIALFLIFIITFFQFLLSIKLFKSLNIQKNNPTEVSPSSGKKLEQQLKEELTLTVLLKMFTVRNAVHKQIGNVHAKAIELAPHDVGISEVLLEKHFSLEEQTMIRSFWELFSQYKASYWITKNEKVKTVFTGDIEKRSGDVGRMILASENLVKKLDLLLIEMQNS
ncbi:hypothetical protein DS745_00280 [Anaerobacillus alkaliphilus]|uniref:Uncharacterized protein n=1 Tax=Anaerobacillus alkaliphilus TaxID=1548597 RepID=A0A4Q0VW65_9BACI|nr:hypothetical protein [Anaerobacillus alkaliphilus]RXJ03864.1 hypothetical protein DS745_00280 [Anaerobacillus alkaliphilus]